MSSAGYRSIAVDLRGHGLSDMPGDDSLYTTDAMVAHVIDILEMLDVDRPVIIGHSMGGALGVHVALRAPGTVRALVLISSIGFGAALPPVVGGVLARRWTIPLARLALRRSVVALGLRILYRENGLVDDRNIDEYWAPSQFSGFVPAMRALLERFRWSRFTPEELARVGIPCLLVRGGRDPIIDRPKNPVRLPPGSRELVIEHAGHLPHDEAPGAVNAALLEFLSSMFAERG
jgi:pimeloyl-ACP methyl ester carboxylesterase